MALVLGDNFSYGGSKPLDARLKYNTTTEMKAVADATMYDGCLAYCSGTDKTYQWKSTNTVDETLGKWREFSSGGGAGGGHTIEDSEGTDLTQRDTLQFGEGFIAEDDDTNEKTVILPDVMQSGDMSEVITPLPSVAPKKEGIKYSTTEQVIGEWIDGKPLYQKTVNTGLPSATGVPHGVSNFDKCVNIMGLLVYSAADTWEPIPSVKDSSSSIRVQCNKTSIYITKQGSLAAIADSYVTIQYTKTTD